MNRIKVFLWVVLFVCLNITLNIVQASTDIALLNVEFAKSEQNKILIKSNEKITDRELYDNQPKFSGDGSIVYFTRALPVSENKQQMDIFAYSIKDKSITNISKSENSSEYSATPYKNDSLSVITVNQENKQHLGQINIKSAELNVFTKAIEPVGYHAWLNDKEAAVFVLGEVMTLQILTVDSDKKSRILAENIGRCIQRIAENKVSYTAEEQGKHRIYILDGEHDSHDTGMVLPKGVQDYVWLNDKEVIFGQDSKLYRMSSETKSEIADLSKLGIKGISRLAIDKKNNRLAVVYNHSL